MVVFKGSGSSEVLIALMAEGGWEFEMDLQMVAFLKVTNSRKV